MEIWRKIKNYEKSYMISNLGRVKSINRKVRNGTSNRIIAERILKQEIIFNNYRRITLSENQKKERFQVHRLVALAFIPNPENKPFVNHKDYNKSNNCVDNLEWVTRRENQCHMGLKNGYPVGVSFAKNMNRYQASIRVDNIKIHLGNFKNPDDAFNAYKNYCLKNNIKNKYIL
jgi:hypothetical protein